jgi:hypothetical protein
LSLLLSNNDDEGDAEGCSAKSYHTKCQIEKYVINAVTQHALVAKTQWWPNAR